MWIVHQAQLSLYFSDSQRHLAPHVRAEMRDSKARKEQ
jgi:hypothetical protein